jgi:RNA recognition motif-containing protein
MATERLADVAPCRTLYVRNLPEKQPKSRIIELLHAAFSPYGAVTWISAEKTVKLRGQAFVTFEDMTSATSALRKMHGCSFLGNVISVHYAKHVSDRASHDAPAARKKRRADRDANATGAADQRTVLHANGMSAEPSRPEDAEMEDAIRNTSESITVAPVVAVPNKILFAERLPSESKEDAGVLLTDLFARFAGFIEVRTVPGKRDIAFIEFESEELAAVALGGLQGHKVGEPPSPLVLSFAKR